MRQARRLLLALAFGVGLTAPAFARPASVQGAAPNGDLSVLRARIEGSNAELAAGDHDGARALAAEAVDALLARPASEQDAAWLALLRSAGLAAFQAQDTRTANRAWKRVYEVESATLPEDHLDLQATRQYLARTIEDLGDLAGARALQQEALEICERALPDDHPGVQSARGNLAGTMYKLGDLAGARILQEKVLDVFSRTLPDDDAGLQRARQGLAFTIEAQGDLEGARILQEKVLEVFSRTLPADHPELEWARQGLAATLYSLGDLDGARSLFEKALDGLSRTLPADHPGLQATRGNLAMTIEALGDLEGARRLFEDVLEARSRTFPEDHPDLQGARQNLGAALHALGELAEARKLFEKVLEVSSRTLPADHPDLQSARLNLAATIKAQGDLAGARALEEKALEVRSSTLPDDHPGLQLARQNLAGTLYALGDLAGARVLFEKVLEVRSRALPDDHPDLQLARQNLAATMHGLGDLAGARALDEQVLEVRLATLPDDHPDLQAARGNLAVTIGELGDLTGARTLEEQVLEAFSRTLPDEHPDLQRARGNLASTIAAEAARSTGGGERAKERCEDLLLALARAQTRAAQQVLVTAPGREAEARCARLAQKLDLVLSFARGFGVFERTSALEAASFELCETARGAALASAGLARGARSSPRYAELRQALVRASDELAHVARQGGTTSADFDRARIERETAERALVSLAQELAGGKLAGLDVRAPALAAELGEGTAAVAFRRFADWRVEVSDAGVAPKQRATERLCAFVVCGSASASLSLVDLGPIEPIEAAVQAWRGALGVTPGRGAAVAMTAPAPDSSATGDALRRLVFDPLLAEIRARQRIVLELDDVLHLVAFDALPLDESGRVLLGDRWRIETRATLSELMAAGREASERDRAAGGFLAVGGVSYDGPETARVAAASTSSAVPERIEVASILRGGGSSQGFAALPATRDEVQGIAAAFVQAFGADAARTVLTEDAATKESVLARASRARYVHVATHGWSNESYRSWSDPTPIDAKSGLGLRLSGEEQVRGMNPMLLCGLALAGANRPEDALGRAPGLITAEEIAALDLSSCELAVLSACDTNAGVRRAGQGVASLQRALQMAGARSVITSLWKVPDEATKELMIDFYRRIWIEGKPKGQALWEAKTRLRTEKDASGRPRYATRDWAAWVLTGEPD